MQQVAIFAAYEDLHALTVARRLVDLGADPIVVNTAALGTGWRVNFYSEDGGRKFSLREPATGSEICFETLAGVWLRRTPPIEIDPAVAQAEIRSFCQDEFVELLLGAMYLFPNVINHPAADRAANRKALQLATARELGFNVPPTLISNDADGIRDFVRSCPNGAVFKILSNTRFQFTETRVFEESHWPLLEATRFAPTIFQTRIKPREHLRVTVVDDDLFVANLRTTKLEAMWDWRLDRDCSITPGTLNAADSERVLAMQRRFGLRYGALDFIVDEDGDTWFLENNPGGQFLFVEIHAGLPISEAIARSLLRPATSSPNPAYAASPAFE